MVSDPPSVLGVLAALVIPVLSMLASLAGPVVQPRTAAIHTDQSPRPPESQFFEAWGSWTRQLRARFTPPSICRLLVSVVIWSSYFSFAGHQFSPFLPFAALTSQTNAGWVVESAYFSPFTQYSTCLFLYTRIVPVKLKPKICFFFVLFFK